jgi:hypothetical protein
METGRSSRSLDDGGLCSGRRREGGLRSGLSTGGCESGFGKRSGRAELWSISPETYQTPFSGIAMSGCRLSITRWRNDAFETYFATSCRSRRVSPDDAVNIRRVSEKDGHSYVIATLYSTTVHRERGILRWTSFCDMFVPPLQTPASERAFSLCTQHGRIPARETSDAGVLFHATGMHIQATSLRTIK